MARTRTVRTVERPASDQSSEGSRSSGERSDIRSDGGSPDGGSPDGDSFDGDSPDSASSDADCDHEQKKSMSNGRNNGYAAAATSASSTVRTGVNHTLGRSDAGRARASSTVALGRKPSPERDNGPPAAAAGHRFAQRQKNSQNAPQYNYGGNPRTQPDWNDLCGRYGSGSDPSTQYGHDGYDPRARDGWNDPSGRDRRGSKQNFGWGNRYHSRSYWDSPNHVNDRSFPRGRDREYESAPGEYCDDRRWGRERDWNRDHDPPHHYSYHRPNINNCLGDHRPRERHTRGKFHGHNEQQMNYFRPYKRQKCGSNQSHNSNHRHRQDSIGWHRSNPSHQRQEHPRNNEVVQALSLDVARLKKEVEEMRKSKNDSFVRPGVARVKKEVEEMRKSKNDSFVRPGPLRNSEMDSTVAGAGQDTFVPVGSSADAAQQHDAASGNVKITDSTGLPSHAGEQTQIASPRGATNAASTSQAGNIETSNDRDESCYGVSTDEEINSSSAAAFAIKEEDGREEANSNEHSPEENANNRPTNITNNMNDENIGQGAFAIKEEDEREEANSNEHAPEENATNRPTNITNNMNDENEGQGAFAIKEEDEREEANSNEHAPEENANNRPTNNMNDENEGQGAFAIKEEDEREEANSNEHAPEENATNRPTNITNNMNDENEEHTDEREKTESNEREPEENAINQPSNVNFAYREEDEKETTQSNTHEPEDNANNQSTNITQNITNADDSDQDSVDLVLRDDYDPDGKIAFCCQNCRCWETSRAKYFHIRNNCGNSGGGLRPGNTKLYHKGCCHGDTKSYEDYLSPMEKAIDKSLAMEQNTDSRSRLDSYNYVKKAYTSAKREEARFENEELNEASDNAIYMNAEYEKCCNNFQLRQKDRRRPLRVLDLFSGIGSGAVVLKRLGLPVCTIVHVEHDPVAVEVCKANHQDDGINHVYIEKFEEVYGTNYEADNDVIVALVDKYGPFDLVLSGSPCQNYSGLNAWRDPNSESAQYLAKAGKLIQKLDEIQMGSKNVKDNVLFLSENVVFKHHDKADQCYGVPPVCLDAKDFSPCKRKRFYWTNIRLRSSAKLKEVASGVSVDDFLDDGYGAVARLLQDEEEQDMPVKANSFLASPKRIDDDRMIKYKLGSSGRKKGGEYHIETYSIAEREKMMGLPTGYLETPVGKLFSELTQKAFVLPESSDENKTYRDFLPREYWHLRKKCKFHFLANAEPPFFQLAISSPLEGKSQLVFYSEKQYCKHLIGNGWSIPVVEYLLVSLTDLFADDVLLVDDKYSTPYPWPYISP